MVLSDKTLSFIADNENNPFCLSVDFYKRDINVVSQYFKQLTFYLSTMTGDSPEEIKKYYKKKFSTGGIFEIVDPVMTLAKTKDIKEANEYFQNLTSIDGFFKGKETQRLQEAVHKIFETHKISTFLLSIGNCSVGLRTCCADRKKT